MPNIITHSLFAEEILPTFELKNDAWLKERAHLFTIGSNGPDFMFFAGLNPKRFFSDRKTGKQLQKIAGQLHKGNVNAFYASALDSIEHEPDPEIKQDMIAYVCGHLCHWALDSTVHPYVYYRTGHGTKQNSFNHHRFESLLDAIVLKVKRTQTLAEFYTPDIANCSMEEARAIARIYVPAIESIFHRQIKGHTIKETLDDWHFIQKAEYDPSGSKLKGSKRVEKVLGLKNVASGLIVPNEPIDNYDVCNLLHKAWLHPADDSLVSKESVFDLYDKALIKGREAVHLFLRAIEDPKAKKAFLEFIGNRSYNLNMDGSPEMRFFDVCDFVK